jgi:hypothetical protein
MRNYTPPDGGRRGTMITVIEKVKRRGFVVEESISGCVDGCPALRLSAVPASEYGQDVFSDLAEGLAARQHTGWEELEGRCPRCDSEVMYRRMFVVSEVYCTKTTVVVEETILA